MKFLSLKLVLFTFCFSFSQNTVKVTSGFIEQIEDIDSKYVTKRNVAVWLPDNYSSVKKYDVLYLQDGQMLFDAEATWNKQAWEIDQTMTELVLKQKINDVIVVGIWNGGASRHIDYFPQKPFESLTAAQQKELFQSIRPNGTQVFSGTKLNSNNYLKFIVTELKPIIDRKYSVNTTYQHTFIGGSSMGAMLSLYAICEYPKVFGGAICMSTHWPGIFTLNNNPIPQAFFSYLKSHLPNNKNHKIYFDYGTKTLDELYQTLQPQVDIIMKSKKFDSLHWKTIKFEGDDHSEESWKNRLHFPLEFILTKKNNDH